MFFLKIFWLPLAINPTIMKKEQAVKDITKIINATKSFDEAHEKITAYLSMVEDRMCLEKFFEIRSETMKGVSRADAKFGGFGGGTFSGAGASGEW